MKKSTLITTIAMIVVVVVALSTATYAWFSASSVSTATVSMTTTATSDWMIFNGTGLSTENVQKPNEKVYSFTSAAAETIPLTNAGLQTGLKAPSSAAWAHTLTVDGTQVKVDSQEFLAAKKGSNNVTVEGVPTVYDPFVLKVSNATGADDKTLKVTVVINAGESQSTGTLYAAAATTFDIAYITTKEGASVQKITKGYSKCATKAGGYVDTDPVTKAEAEDNETASSFASGSSTVFAYANATAMNSQTGLYTNFLKAPAENLSAEQLAWGLSANQYYLAYSFVISDIDKTDSVYLSIYPWIDGWLADNSAGGASYSINFAFTTVSAGN